MRRATLVGRTLVLLLVGLSSRGASASSYYVDYSTGSDSNPGTKVSPWKLAPGMKGRSAATLLPGDFVYFKGGVTWPSACYQWQITADGAAGNLITYAADPTWYVGGSFTRPLFDFQNTIVGSGWTLAAGIHVQADYVVFDNLELANFRAPLQSLTVSTWGSTAICYNEASNNTITNCLIRDWDQPTPIPNGGLGGGAVMRVNNGTGNLVINTIFTCAGTSTKTGTCIWNIPTAFGCTFSNVVSAMLYGQTSVSNVFDTIVDPTGDAAAHSNVMLCPGGLTAANNIIRNVQGRAQVIYLEPGYGGGNTTDLIYNNVAYNVAQPCVVVDPRAPSASASTTRIQNNTFVGPGGSGYCVRLATSSGVGTIGTLDIRNNHLISDGTAIQRESTVTISSYTHNNNLTNTVAQATANGFTSANVYAPPSAAAPTYNTGTDLSAYFTTDLVGTARPQAAVWDIGAYEFVPTTGAGTLTLSVGTSSVTENAGSKTITAKRTGGSTGVVGISYGTAAGTATPGVNYTTTMGTFSWGNGDTADKTVAVPILNVPFYGSKTFTFTIATPTGGATLGTPSTQTVTINGVGSPPVNVLPGLGPWLATDSDYAPPFTASGTTLSQSTFNADTNGAGIAIFRFALASAGNYKSLANVTAPNEGANSFQVSMNGETPFAWHIPTNAAAADHYITTNSTFDTEGTLQVWSLPAGTNELVIYGREAGTILATVEMRLVADEPPVDPPMILSTVFTTADGYYRATSNIVIQIPFSTNVTVTGTPRLTNNAGGLFTYTSGSGSPTLTFTYTVQAGENSQALDYVATTSLSLNGGTIRFGAVDADLTLPAPGTPGSLSSGRTVVIDTTPPTAMISGPSSVQIPVGGTAFYQVGYFDLNFDANQLEAADLTLNGTTTGAIAIGPNNPFNGVGVTITGLTVGTGSLTLAAGTATDLAGNLALGAGPSAAFNVSTTTGSSIHLKAGTIISHK